MPGFWSGCMEEEDASNVAVAAVAAKQQLAWPSCLPLSKHRRTSAPAAPSPNTYIRGSYRHYMHKLVRSETHNQFSGADFKMAPNTSHTDATPLSSSLGENLDQLGSDAIATRVDTSENTATSVELSLSKILSDDNPHQATSVHTVCRLNDGNPLNYVIHSSAHSPQGMSTVNAGRLEAGDVTLRQRRTGAVNTRGKDVDVAPRHTKMQFPCVSKLIHKYTALINEQAERSKSSHRRKFAEGDVVDVWKEEMKARRSPWKSKKDDDVKDELTRNRLTWCRCKKQDGMAAPAATAADDAESADCFAEDCNTKRTAVKMDFSAVELCVGFGCDAVLGSGVVVSDNVISEKDDNPCLAYCSDFSAVLKPSLVLKHSKEYESVIRPGESFKKISILGSGGSPVCYDSAEDFSACETITQLDSTQPEPDIMTRIMASEREVNDNVLSAGVLCVSASPDSVRTVFETTGSGGSLSVCSDRVTCVLESPRIFSRDVYAVVPIDGNVADGNQFGDEIDGIVSGSCRQASLRQSCGEVGSVSSSTVGAKDSVALATALELTILDEEGCTRATNDVLGSSNGDSTFFLPASLLDSKTGRRDNGHTLLSSTDVNPCSITPCSSEERVLLAASSLRSPRSSGGSDEGCSLLPQIGSSYSLTPCSSEEDLIEYRRSLSIDSAVSLGVHPGDDVYEENVFIGETKGGIGFYIGDDTGVSGEVVEEKDLGDETGSMEKYMNTKSKGTNTTDFVFDEPESKSERVFKLKGDGEHPMIFDFFSSFDNDVLTNHALHDLNDIDLDSSEAFKLEDSKVELRNKVREKFPYTRRKSTLTEEEDVSSTTNEREPIDFHLKAFPSSDNEDDLIELRWQSTQTEDNDFPNTAAGGKTPGLNYCNASNLRRQSNQIDDGDIDACFRDSAESRRFSTQTYYNDSESLYSRRESIYFRPDCIELRRQSTQTEDNDFDYDYRRDSFDSRRGSIEFRRDSVDYRRQSTQSFQTDDEEPIPSYRYWRTPSVVVSDYSDETLAVTLEEIEQFRGMTTPSDAASSIGTGSGCSSVSVLDTEYALKTPLSRKGSCSSCSTLSGDEDACESPLQSVTPANKPSGWRKLRNIVQWTPFFQTYKKQRYPWVQLAGHQGNFKAGTEPGTILKKLCPKEELCFQVLMKDVLRPYVPEYKGHLTCNDQDSTYLQLQDLLGDFTSPCVMDCKIGVRTYLEEELAKAKEKPKLRKDMYDKMIQIDSEAPTDEEHRLKGVTKPRYMVWRETISSTATLGFRIEGIKKSDGKSSKDFKTTKSRAQITGAFKDFTAGFPQSIPKYIQRLKAIKATLEVSKFFSSHEVIGSSLLFVHDQSNTNVWLIDFAKTLVLPPGVAIDHGSKWIVGNHEDGYYTGINNLISIFEELLEEQSHLPAPQVTTIITDASEEDTT